MTSQFEQQVRAICGLPLGSTELLRPAAMANLLGDLWADADPELGGGLPVSGREAAPLRQGAAARRAARWATSPLRASTVMEAQERVIAARDALLI